MLRSLVNLVSNAPYWHSSTRFIIFDLQVPKLKSGPPCRLLAASIQQPAPSFKGTAVVNGDFKEISLSDYKGKYLVLFFYPLDL